MDAQIFTTNLVWIIIKGIGNVGNKRGVKREDEDFKYATKHYQRSLLNRPSISSLFDKWEGVKTLLWNSA